MYVPEAGCGLIVLVESILNIVVLVVILLLPHVCDSFNLFS